MSKSPFVARLDRVQSGLRTILRPLGFTKKGRIFNRATEEGVVQVVALQNGPFEIGTGTYGQPSFYGKFTVNLGVYVKEAWDRMHGAFPERKTVHDADCAVRTRLSWLDSGNDYWWSLDDSADALIDQVGGLLIGVGIPFLDRFGTRDEFVAEFKRTEGDVNVFGPAGRLDVAMILLARGDRPGAKALLQEQARQTEVRNHRAYVRELSVRLGLGELED